MPSKRAQLMFVGFGPHAKSVYLPAIEKLSSQYPVSVNVVVEIESLVSETRRYFEQHSRSSPKIIGIKPSPGSPKLAPATTSLLNQVAQDNSINGVVIACEPLSHMQYAVWAMKRDYHIMLDKPISTYEKISCDEDLGEQLFRDFLTLSELRDYEKAFVVHSQRRYHPGFQYVFEHIKEVASAYGIPLTSMQAMECDGQWRLPHEIVTQDYHPYNSGYGKLSHSGYHTVDVVACAIDHSFKAASKDFDAISAFTRAVSPRGLLKQMTRADYINIFGKKYITANDQTDERLYELYKEYGEIDCSSVITLENKGDEIAEVSLNSLHNSFARRDWLAPGIDLYKGNGRVKHEAYTIQQGPMQCVQIHAYQVSDTPKKYTSDDYNFGGKNHFDVYVFRNNRVMGGEPLIIERSSSFAKEINHSVETVLSEHVQMLVVEEYIKIILDLLKPSDSISGLEKHALTTQLMSLLYRSLAAKNERRIVWNSQSSKDTSLNGGTHDE